MSPAKHVERQRLTQRVIQLTIYAQRFLVACFRLDDIEKSEKTDTLPAQGFSLSRPISQPAIQPQQCPAVLYRRFVSVGFTS